MPWHDLKKYPRSDKRCTVYLFHFSRPFGHAMHYVGATFRDVEERIAEHKRGHGARLTKLVIEAGIELILARVWHDVPRYFELKLKSRGKREVCPICKALALDVANVHSQAKRNAQQSLLGSRQSETVA